MTRTVDMNGHTHYIVNVFSSAHGTDSINWVQHIYIVGVVADWVDIINGLETVRDIFDMMALLMVLLMIASRYHIRICVPLISQLMGI